MAEHVRRKRNRLRSLLLHAGGYGERVLRYPMPASMVAVAQLVRVLDCDSRCRGFESPQPPHFSTGMNIGRPQPTTRLPQGACLLQCAPVLGPLAQLVEQLTLNQ